MRTETELRNRRLLEALDYIDGKYIDEALNCIYAPPRNKGYVKDPRTNLRILKQTLLAAACILLISALIPTVTLILEKAGIIAPGGITSTTDPDEDLYQNYVLTLDELQRINIIWEKYEGEKFADTPDEACARWEYRGKYGDCIILRAKKENTNSSEYSIIAGNYRFSCDGGTYYVCRDFDVCTLLYAYEYGLINDLQVQKLNEYHVELEGYDSGGYVDEREYICAETVPVAMPFDVIGDAVHAYFKELSKTEINMDPELYSEHINDLIYYVRCPAKFGENYAVMISWLDPYGGNEVYDLYLTEKGSVFGTMTGSMPCILQDGELIPMETAYDKGIITFNELDRLVNFLNDEAALYPTKVYDPTKIGGNIALDSLTVTLMPYAYKNYYSADSFSEIGCTDVTPLFGDYTDQSVQQYKLAFPEKTYAELIKAYTTLSMRCDIYTVETNAGKTILTEDEFIAEYINGDPYHSNEYVGKYGNCYVVIYHNTLLGITSSETIGEYTFEFGGYSKLKAFYDNEFIDLSSAYEQGLISESDLVDIYIYHKWGRHIDVEIISPVDVGFQLYEAKKIIYERYSSVFVPVLVKNKYKIFCFGKRDGMYALLYDEPADMVVTEEVINGLKFVYKNSQTISILKDRQNYTLKEAFEWGIISVEFLTEIHENYSGT